MNFIFVQAVKEKDVGNQFMYTISTKKLEYGNIYVPFF